MNLNPSYKQSEVGVIPNEWEIVPISELVSEFRGGAPLKPSDFTNSGIKVLPKGGVGRKGWLTIEDADLQYCSPSYATSHRNNQVDQNFTIVVLRDLVPSGPSIGLIVQIKEPETFVLAQGVYGFKVNERSDPCYLIQLSNTRWYRLLMNSIMVGSTQVHITNTAFKAAKIPLPPLPEQRTIATALSDVDMLLAAQDKVIAKKRDIKQAAMQQLLTGKQRLQGFTGEWEVKRLGDVLKEIADGATPSTANRDNFDGSISWVVIDDIKDEIWATKNTLSEKGLLSCAATLWQPGTLILSTGATIGEVGIARVPVATKQGICGLVFDAQSMSTEFMKYWFVLNKPLLLSKAQGSSIKEVRAPTLIQFEVHLPYLDEQTTIATILSDMDADLTALEQQRDKTRALKQGMMQELLTGRIRLV